MAVDSQVGIYNLALNSIGERSNVSLPTENSRRAEVCNLWYETVRDQILEAAPWPEASEMVSLAQVAEETDGEWTEGDPRAGYVYTYQLPTDCIRPQYLADFTPFLLGVRRDARVMYANASPAILTYTKRQANISLWSTSLRMAVVYGLAAHICMPLTGKPSRARVLAEKGNEIIMEARVNAANSSNETFEHMPEWITARGYAGGVLTQYFYPSGSLLALTNVS